MSFMKIFISSSGDFAKSLAEPTKRFLDQVLPNIDTFQSSIDILNGEQWLRRLNEELGVCKYGILILTKDSQHSDWVHFEAGALSKGSIENQIIPICFDFPIEELYSPIKNIFQGFTFNKEKVEGLVHQINENSDSPKDNKIINSYLEKYWDEYFEEIQDLIKNNEKCQKEPDETTKIINEIIRNRNFILNIVDTLGQRMVDVKLRKPPNELLEPLQNLALNYAYYVQHDLYNQEFRLKWPKKRLMINCLTIFKGLIINFNLLKSRYNNLDRLLEQMNTQISNLEKPNNELSSKENEDK